MLFTAIIMGGTAFFFTQYLQVVKGLTPMTAGLWLIPQAIGMIASSLLTPVIAKRFRAAHILTAGLLLTTLGFLLLTQVDGSWGWTCLITGMIATASGVAPVVVLGTNLVISSAPPEKAGAAASMSETSNQLGIALGVAALGSLGTMVYRLHLLPRLPEGLPGTVLSAAKENITGALTAAGSLPAPAANALIRQARLSFTAGMEATSLLAAVGMAGLAVVCFTVLKKK
jgi:DHA2 family multidrug resistance protein-like MFS transporter